MVDTDLADMVAVEHEQVFSVAMVTETTSTALTSDSSSTTEIPALDSFTNIGREMTVKFELLTYFKSIVYLGGGFKKYIHWTLFSFPSTAVPCLFLSMIRTIIS